MCPNLQIMISYTNKPIKEEPKWYIFYTCPRAEKVAYKILKDLNYTVFLPIRKTLKIWKNRQRKFIQEPLFPNYIFVNTNTCYLHKITMLPKICYYLSTNGKPSSISEQDIEALKCMVNSQEEITVEINPQIGEKVVIIKGDLTGYEGVLVSCKGKQKFGIQLAGTNLIACIDVTASIINIVKE